MLILQFMYIYTSPYTRHGTNIIRALNLKNYAKFCIKSFLSYLSSGLSGFIMVPCLKDDHITYFHIHHLYGSDCAYKKRHMVAL